MFEDLRKEDPEAEEPELFADEVYKRMKPGRIMTSCFNTGWQEGGFVYLVRGGVLTYFEIRNEEVGFSIFGNEVDADGVRDALIEGLGDVKRLLEVDGADQD